MNKVKAHTKNNEIRKSKCTLVSIELSYSRCYSVTAADFIFFHAIWQKSTPPFLHSTNARGRVCWNKSSLRAWAWSKYVYIYTYTVKNITTQYVTSLNMFVHVPISKIEIVKIISFNFLTIFYTHFIKKLDKCISESS